MSVRSFYIRHGYEQTWREFEQFCMEDDRSVSSVLMRLIKEWVDEERKRRTSQGTDGRGGSQEGRAQGAGNQDQHAVRSARSGPETAVEDVVEDDAEGS